MLKSKVAKKKCKNKVCSEKVVADFLVPMSEQLAECRDHM